MKVVLLADVPKLGRKSEVKNVSPGYAKNFLFPRGLAMVLTSTAVLELEQQDVAKKKQAEKDLIETETLAQKLDGLEIEIAMKVSKDGVGYAGVSIQRIADVLVGLGFKISKSQVKINSPIKKLGEYAVVISLPHNLEAEVKITVVAEPEG
ncbi:MAG: 50S ribosomal protein L9 [Candidatus Sungbacteria bacterium]|uniref:Large ribosomal subunit protein bL9 n=1 Tax=Candidatus Sungiibacteriota bacterium TaxID=2750080 RepID=A0A9D6HPK3_9BACT|nr:50S ribosomal protein L9 [Candidatus Sungbacteria bacterium]